MAIWMVARLRGRSKKPFDRKRNRLPNTTRQPVAFSERVVFALRRARDFRGFGIDTPSVKSVVDNLSHGRNVRINVHSITRRKMTNNALGGNVQHRTGQL